MEGKGREFEGGEVRRVHIIYFLSRMGRIEHPHLIRVHHLGRRGVHLRDVKRWLSELRGKDMPDSFSWSFKRRYKNGYVWQDLVDEDLISPISDNEFVLKGSSITTTFDDDQKRSSSSSTTQKLPNPAELKDSTSSEMKMEESLKYKAVISDQIITSTYEMDSETSTVTDEHDDSIIKTGTTSSPAAAAAVAVAGDDHDQVVVLLQEEQQQKKTTEIEELSCTDEDSKEYCYWKKNGVEVKDQVSKKAAKRETSSGVSSRTNTCSFSKSRSKRGAASSVLRNLLSCRAVDINNSVVTSVNKTSSSSSSCSSAPNLNVSSEISRVDNLRGSNAIFCGPWNPKQDNRKSFKKSKEKKVSTVYSTVAEPNCSQCGKAFKPEKLHKHMRSCRGLKSFRKSHNISANKTKAQMQMVQTAALSKEVQT